MDKTMQRKNSKYISTKRGMFSTKTGKLGSE
jgi:hypothetical protein